ncbi:MAG: hypothetical protein ACOCWG_01940 [bacterium]
MQKSKLMSILCLLTLILTVSICFFSIREKDLIHQKKINDVLILNRNLKYQMTQQIKYNFYKANGENILHSYLRKKPIGPLSELFQNKSYIFYIISENACNPCVSDLNKKVLLALNEIDKSSFYIVGTKNHIYNHSNIMKHLNIDLKENLLISFNSFFIKNIKEDVYLLLFTMNDNLICNNLFIINDSNIHLIKEYLSNACSSLKK